MNFILNLDCNNHCPYCFQHSLKKVNDEFKINDLEKVLQWAGFFPSEACIHILGGEPTLYTAFPQAIDLIHSYYPSNRLLIITNLLGTEINIEYIKSILLDIDIDLLLNTTIDKDKKEIFFKRLKQIYEIKPTSICLSITLMYFHQINIQFIDYLHYLLQEFPLIKSVRIGLQMPGGAGNFQRYCYDDDIRLLCTNIPIDVEIGIDCSAPECLLSQKCITDLSDHLAKNIVRAGCPGPAVDLMPDFSAKYCFSSSNQYQVSNIFDFPNYTMLQKHLLGLEHLRQIKSSYCLECEKYKQGICLPCHGLDDAWFERGL